MKKSDFIAISNLGRRLTKTMQQRWLALGGYSEYDSRSVKSDTRAMQCVCSWGDGDCGCRSGDET